MTVKAFVDTNVLLYVFDHDPEATAKRALAKEILASREHSVTFSAQVLGEFYVNARKPRFCLSNIEAAQLVAEFAELEVIPSDAELVAGAIATSIESQVSYWDALIIEAAARAQCDVLLTEDLNAGATIRGVRIVNPFAEAS